MGLAFTASVPLLEELAEGESIEENGWIMPCLLSTAGTPFVRVTGLPCAVAGTGSGCSGCASSSALSSAVLARMVLYLLVRLLLNRLRAARGPRLGWTLPFCAGVLLSDELGALDGDSLEYLESVCFA